MNLILRVLPIVLKLASPNIKPTGPEGVFSGPLSVIQILEGFSLKAMKVKHG